MGLESEVATVKEQGRRTSESSIRKVEVDVVLDAIDTIAERAYGPFHSLPVPHRNFH